MNIRQANTMNTQQVDDLLSAQSALASAGIVPVATVVPGQDVLDDLEAALAPLRGTAAHADLVLRRQRGEVDQEQYLRELQRMIDAATPAP